jgi:hypothetical protein
MIFKLAQAAEKSWRRLKGSPAEIDEFGVGARPIFVFGYVKYADAFGLLHTKGFCFLNRLNKPPIELAGGPSYNYSRSEKIPNEYAT